MARWYNLRGNDFFEVIDTEEKAYWLGMLAADGAVTSSLINGKPYYRVILSLEVADEYHVARFAEIFGTSIRSAKHTQRSGYVGTYTRSTVCRNKVALDLIGKGIVPRKTLNPILVTTFDSVPSELARHFIRGYFDGDGGISTNAGGVTRISFVGQEIFLSRLVDIVLESLVVNRPLVHRRANGIVSIAWASRDSVRKFYHYFYDEATVYLERKKEKFEGISWFTSEIN